jgi:hypothetical protein
MRPTRIIFPLGEEANMADESVIGQVRDLLGEVSETHHQVFRITEGADDDWASWYADWLTKLSELPSLLSSELVRSELVYQLVKLDKEFTVKDRTEAWEDYYAARLVNHFGGR